MINRSDIYEYTIVKLLDIPIDLVSELDSFAQKGWRVILPINYHGNTTALLLERVKVWEPPHG